MASLKDQLNDYLSKSNTDSGSKQNLLQADEKSGYFSSFSWGKTSSQSSPPAPEIDETSNGWFTEAQKDPCLPSLVCRPIKLLTHCLRGPGEALDLLGD